MKKIEKTIIILLLLNMIFLALFSLLFYSAIYAIVFYLYFVFNLLLDRYLERIILSKREQLIDAGEAKISYRYKNFFTIKQRIGIVLLKAFALALAFYFLKDVFSLVMVLFAVFVTRHLLRRESKGILVIALYILFILAFDFYQLGRNDEIDTRRFSYDIAGYDGNVKILQISDIHIKDIDNEEREVLQIVEIEKPDIIFLTGDIFEGGVEMADVAFFLDSLTAKADTYYILGNHEFYRPSEIDILLDVLNESDVRTLYNESALKDYNGLLINITGLIDPDAFRKEKFGISRDEGMPGMVKQWKVYLDDSNSRKGKVEILLSHRPEYGDVYSSYDYDFVFSGHAHGGQVAIPKILENGLVAPNQSIFPKFTNGEYELENNIGKTYKHIISRGIIVRIDRPRLYNRPEIIVVNLQ